MDFSYVSLDPVPVTRPDERSRLEDRTFQGIPGIECASCGRLFAVWYTGGHGEGCYNYVQLSISDDKGKSWQHNVAVVNPQPEPVRAFDAVVWNAPDGRLFLFWAQCCGAKPITKDVFDGLGGVWFSVLQNPEADPEDFVFTPPRRISHGVMMNKPTVLSDGTWALPCSLWTSDDYIKHESLNCTQGALMVVSEDNGATFKIRGLVDMHNAPGGPNCDEHMFLERSDGSIVCYVRSKAGVAESISTDKGYTWSEPVLSQSIHTTCTRFFIRRMQSGKVLLAFNDSIEFRANMSVMLSDDEGRSWNSKLLLDERRFTSYPDGCQAPDGTIYVIHDRGRSGGGEILLSRFTEDDIIAGKSVSPDCMISVKIACSKPVPETAKFDWHH